MARASYPVTGIGVIFFLARLRLSASGCFVDDELGDVDEDVSLLVVLVLAVEYAFSPRGEDNLEVDGGRVGDDVNTVVDVAALPLPPVMDGERERNIRGFGWNWNACEKCTS